MSQKVTKRAQREEVSCQQAVVIERLLMGDTVTAAAQAAGVARETVHRWKKSDWKFQANLNQAMRELQEATVTRLVSAAHRSADVVAKAVERGNLKASLAILKGLGALPGAIPRFGHIDPKVLQEEADIETSKEDFDRVQRSMFPF